MQASTKNGDYIRYLALAASIAVFVLIVLGGIVRVTESGGACLDWPTCFGALTPPAGQAARLDYLHRAATVVSGGLVIAAAAAVRRYHRWNRLVGRPIFVAVGLMLFQVVLGAYLALMPAKVAPSVFSAVHLGLSLLTLASLLIATVVAFFQQISPPRDGEDAYSTLRFRSSFARLAIITLVAYFVLLISGTVLANSGAGAACETWPSCDGALIPMGWAIALNLLHRAIVLSVATLMVVLFIQAWKTQRNLPTVLVSTTAAMVLLIAQALLGAQMVAGFPPHLLVLHGATAVAVWGALIVQVVAVGIARPTSEDEGTEKVPATGRKELAKDLLMLTKPVVVLLLLVTTYAGMVIAAQAWPGFRLAFWTLLGGFMAAGGSGAINQYIDRFDDLKMQRTQKRPIPAGRLTPAQGLAFGVGMELASFYIMLAFVNWLAALLTLAGILYYVLLYSILLKKTTVQNIVIGGGAGAIPPLVGWAAATGSLNIPSLFLFAVIFMWTPPHFWALALVRRKDYARAGVPMLPVIRGEQETRWQIFLYTVELVALTLLLPLFGLGSSIYFIGALMLGLWLLAAAWRVWKQGGNKLAWKMYRYSSMYLAFLMAVLMVDALL